MILARVTLFALLLVGTAQAQNCDGSQSEMTQCAGKAFHAADSALNTVYNRLLTRLEPTGKTRLRDAQRAWLMFRDKQCAFMASGVEGGSVQPMIVAECLEAETRTRTEALRSILTCSEGDLSCP